MALKQRVYYAWVALTLYLLPEAVLAHSAERGLVMLLPTGYYLVGAATAVAGSFLLLSLAPARYLMRLAEARLRLFSCAILSPVVTSSASFILMSLLLAAGVLGSTDPLSNPLPLAVWTGGWVGFTLLQTLCGNLWPYLNPWLGPLWCLRQLSGWRPPPLVLPAKLGYWPAILIFYGFAWYEIVALAPEDPASLAGVVACYWGLNFCGILLFGEDDWLQRVEPFAIFFRLVGACSPLLRETTVPSSSTRRGDVRFYLAWPGAAFLKLAPLPWSGVVFVLLTLSSVSFDGFAKTFFWLHLLDINPLAFPGRSAIQVQNTLGLIGALVVLVGLFRLTVECGWRLVRPASTAAERLERGRFCGTLVYSIVPISIVFHAAHYLTLLLVNGQYLWLAINDPLKRGWQLFAITSEAQVTTSFLSNLHSVYAIWTLQTVIIAGGHIIGITLAHNLALQIFSQQPKPLAAARKSQVFLALLMIGYTVFGLWLLSTPAI